VQSLLNNSSGGPKKNYQEKANLASQMNQQMLLQSMMHGETKPNGVPTGSRSSKNQISQQANLIPQQ
jgi:hypothetical protein